MEVNVAPIIDKTPDITGISSTSLLGSEHFVEYTSDKQTYTNSAIRTTEGYTDPNKGGLHILEKVYFCEWRHILLC